MFPKVALLVWVLFTFTVNRSFLLADAQSQGYSTNPDDYDFGWIAGNVHEPDSLPVCAFCINALGDPQEIQPGGNATTGPYWNRTVGIYRCDGVQDNEMWAYQSSTEAIVFSNLLTYKSPLCVDAQSYATLGMKMLPCDSSSLSQRWTRDGNRLISGLSDPSTEPLLLVGLFPNVDSAYSQTYRFSLNLAQSAGNNPAGLISTTNFTFLSSKNWVNESLNTFTTEGLLKAASLPLDQITNGDFERSTIQAGTGITNSDWVQLRPSYFSMCGWVIDYGPIDYVKSGYITAESYTYSVHLNTYTNQSYAGSISQAIRTEADKEYVLSFFMGGFPPVLSGSMISGPSWRNCSEEYLSSKIARMRVQVIEVLGTSGEGNTITEQNFTFDVTKSTNTDVGWAIRNVSFRSVSNVTKISFASLNSNDSCGPMIDTVSIIPHRPKKSNAVLWVVVGSVVGGAVLIAFLAALVCARRYSAAAAARDDVSGLYKSEHARIFSSKEITISTKKFSSIIGEGAFGTVYKAEFPDGTVGAVKVEKPKGLNSSSKVLASEEIAVLLRVHHRNLVNLTGFCIHKGRHMLVFEYLPNGSLYDRLHQSILNIPPVETMDSIEMEKRGRMSKVLSWPKRVKIASDVAYGLEYLHYDADPPIVHRDVKSQNILLTANDSAKLADFGLSKAAPAEATAFQSIETMVRGSIGYLDPQYFLTGVFSSKSDVYSYGVVLLELISGHQAIYNAASLASWAAPYIADPALYHQLVDTKLNSVYEPNELESLIELSKMCMQEESKLRPNMRQVVAFLMSRNLVVVGESSEQVKSLSTKETLSRESYHKMRPLFLDVETGSQESVASSNENFLWSMSKLQLPPRD